jgi:predicted acyltransferase
MQDNHVAASRIASIDQFRGFAILSMVLANFMGGIRVVPAWLKHAPDIGLTIIDLIAPFFIFAISLTFGMSFQRRVRRDGAGKTYSHFLVRYLSILGAGAIISAGESALGFNAKGVDWGVLQAIGMAGIVTLLVIRLPGMVRAGIGLGLLVIYQWLLDTAWLQTVLASPHGGLFGSLSWAAMLILATSLADLFHDPRRGKWFPWAGLLVMAAGGLAAYIAPVSKNRVSSSYVLISLGASTLLFLFFHWLNRHFGWRARLLETWGKNPLLLYFLHYILIGIVFLPGVPVLYVDAPVWLVLVEMAFLIGGITAAAYWLARQNYLISL